jgi:hypothetical protein
MDTAGSSGLLFSHYLFGRLLELRTSRCIYGPDRGTAFYLAQQPLLRIRSENEPEIRSLLHTKQNRLYYQVKENKIIVLNIFDIRQNPLSDKFQSK